MGAHRHPVTRRVFLGAASAVSAATILPRHVLGGPDRTPPSETITYGVIGNGNRKDGGLQGMKAFQRIAVCDVDKTRIGGEPDNKRRFLDFRRMLERRDMDVVCIATPPHWHAIMCIMAAQAGKDIFCEKPMTKFIAEGRAVVEAVNRYGVVFQIGTFARFKASREVHKLVKSGLLKDLKGVVARAVASMRTGRPSLPAQPVPDVLDYELWLGPAPYKPYNKERVHYNNRFYWDYEGGDLTNNGFHSFDPIQYTYAKDDTGPVVIEPHAVWPQHPDCVDWWQCAVLTYADGLKVVVDSAIHKLEIVGSRTVSAKDLSAEDRRRFDALPDPPKLVPFPDAVRTRQQAGGNAETSHRASTALNLANIAIRLGRTIRWDPVAEQVVGDDEANRFVDIPLRAPWHL